MAQKTMRELDIQGYRTYIRPKLGLIDEKGKELFLKNETIERAKRMAIEYFKKTYGRLRCSSARHMLPSFIYIASIIEGDKVSQKDIAKVFGTTNVTIIKWNKYIIETMGLDIEHNRTVRDIKGIRRRTLTVNRYTGIIPDMTLIDEGGKILGSDSLVIKMAKDIATKYFDNILSRYHNLPTTKTILPSLFYLVSIIGNDRRNQIDIAMKFNVSESHISVWYKDITDTLGIKIVYGFDRKVLRIIEEKNDL
jgi:DNA-binding transcriptional regulator YiaG